MEKLTLTELETDLLEAFAEGTSMYLVHLLGYAKKISSKQISGVVSSLVKKGLVETWYDNEVKEEVLNLTDKGIQHTFWA